jgi:hypothetical protein
VKTIFGSLAISVVVYRVVVAVRRVIPKFPQPVFIAAPVFLVGLFTLPSLPRDEFERDALAKFEGKAWVRVVNTMRVGSATEPLTWLRTPVGSITIIMPHSAIEEGVFRQVTMRYEQEPTMLIVEPDCSASLIIYASPGAKGTVRYTSASPSKMSATEKTWYCGHDWSKEREALRQETLRQMKEAQQ